MSEDAKAAIDDAEKAVEQWKVKKLISTLEAARGNGTSMISLIVPPKDQISRVSKMLNDEMGTATHIKSRVNRQSVLGAITSTMQRLKLYNRVPTNGLVIYWSHTTSLTPASLSPYPASPDCAVMCGVWVVWVVWMVVWWCGGGGVVVV